MKKYLLFLVFLFPLLLLAQATFWEEPFDNNDANWELDSNWSIDGGKLEFYYSPTVTNYDLSAVSPVINLPDNVGDMVVKQWISTYSIVDEIAEIAILHDGSESILWEYEMLEGDWGEMNGTDISLSLSSFAGESIQLRFRSYGESTWNLNNWDVYNITIFAMYDNDLAFNEFIGPMSIEQNQVGSWFVVIENKGINEIDSYSVQVYQDETYITELYNEVPIYSEEAQTLDFSYQFVETGDFNLTAEVVLDNDEFLDNNISSPFQISVYPEGALQILIWDNDNNSHLTDPDNYQTVGCEYGLEKALESNLVYHDTVTELPDYLYEYDAIFATLGIYCVG